MAEKTLGQVAKHAFVQWQWLEGVNPLPDQWEFVADTAIAAHEARRWKPIESAPKDGTPIDVWTDGYRQCDVEWAVEKKAWAIYGYDSMEHLGWHVLKPQPTHWAPIPAPPKEADHE